MKVIAINVSVVFAFGVIITLIVFKGLMQAKEYDTRKKELEKRLAAESISAAPQ